MTRKRSNRRPVPMAASPVVFGFPPGTLTSAKIEADLALATVMTGSGGEDEKLVSLLALKRIADFCSLMMDRMLWAQSYTQDAVADLEPIVALGAAAVKTVVERHDAGLALLVGPEDHTAIAGLLDVYAAILASATRREAESAIKSLGMRS